MGHRIKFKDKKSLLRQLAEGFNDAKQRNRSTTIRYQRPSMNAGLFSWRENQSVNKFLFGGTKDSLSWFMGIGLNLNNPDLSRLTAVASANSSDRIRLVKPSIGAVEKNFDKALR